MTRFRAQLLHRPPGGVVDVVRHLLAVQAQDVSAFPLAFRARSKALVAADVVAAREKREIVRCWGPRGTLHLVAVEDLAWLYPLVAPSPAGSLRRLRELGADPSLDAAAVLAGRGPVTKAELGALLGVEGQAIVHLAALAAGRGLVVLGPERAGKATYVHAGDWLGAPLPAYDEYLLGWQSRPAGFRSAGGVIRSVVLVDGRVVGTWRGRRGDLTVEPFEPLTDVVRAGVEKEIAAIDRFL